MENNVVFRRIRGRIVPVRVNPEQKRKRELAKGAAMVVAGAGAVTGSEYLAGRMLARSTKKAAQFGEAAIELGRVAKAQQLLGLPYKGATQRAWQVGQKFSKPINRSIIKASYIKGGGKLFGAALAGAGVARLVDQMTKGKDPGAIEQTASGVIGSGIALGGGALFSLAMKRGLRGTSIIKVGKQLRFKGI
jgi:hypothetical protein